MKEEEKQEIFEYLDELRESGAVNMWSCPRYIEEEFRLDKHEARKVAQAWMCTFAERHPE